MVLIHLCCATITGLFPYICALSAILLDLQTNYMDIHFNKIICDICDICAFSVTILLILLDLK